MSKTSKRRPCPVTQRVISSTECATSRVSRYNCPATCLFNPFSPPQYNTYTEIESRVMRKSLEWFVNSSPDPAQTLSQLKRITIQSDLDRHGYQITEFYYKRDANGRTCAERWAAAGFPNLNNDERVVLSATIQLRLRLIEVHRVLDDLRIEAVDLLDTKPTELLICDRALAARACRFTTYLIWLFPLPHFWRTFGFVLHIPQIGPFEPQEVAEEIVRHLGGPAAREQWNEWFGYNLTRFANALTAVALARQEQTLASMDAEFGRAVYELRAPFEDCCQALDAIAEVAPDELTDEEFNDGFTQARVWFDQSSEFVLLAGKTRPELGRVLLGPKYWRLEAMGGDRLPRLRAQFETALGDRVQFCKETREDLAAKLKSREQNYDPSLVPPRLLQEPSKLVFSPNRIVASVPSNSHAQLNSDVVAEFYRTWMETPLPVFGGQTPRQAALDPALRPKLIRLLKDHVRSCDEMNLKTGGSADVNWMLKELGAHEIVFDPPPARSKPPQTDDEPDELEDDLYDPTEGLDPWPPMPPRPFTHEEALERLTIGPKTFETAQEAMDAMNDAGGFLIDDVRAVIGKMLDEEEYAFLANFLLQAWFVFVPPGCFGPDIEAEDFYQAMQRQFQSLQLTSRRGGKKSASFFLKEGPQPALVQVLAGLLLENWERFAPHQEKAEEHQTLMLIILKAIIELLDAKCRGKVP